MVASTSKFLGQICGARCKNIQKLLIEFEMESIFQFVPLDISDKLYDLQAGVFLVS